MSELLCEHGNDSSCPECPAAAYYRKHGYPSPLGRPGYSCSRDGHEIIWKLRSGPYCRCGLAGDELLRAAVTAPAPRPARGRRVGGSGP